MTAKKEVKTAIGFGDDIAEMPDNVEVLNAEQRQSFIRPLPAEFRARLFSTMAALIESGLDVETASRLVIKESTTQIARVTECFFGKLTELRGLDPNERAGAVDKLVIAAFGNTLDPEEIILIHAMAISKNLVPLLITASKFASSGSPRMSREMKDDMRRQEANRGNIRRQA